MNKYLVVLLALAGLIPANAQYTFTIDGGFSGDCARVIGVRELNTQLQQLKGQAISGFPDQSSCEQVRNLVNSVKAQAEMIIYDARTGRTIDRKKYNCYFKLTASPCTGRPMNRSTINIGVPNIKGVNQGTSFYSTNGAQEINDWSNNYMEQILALKKNAQKQMTASVSTGDDEYDRARNSSLPVIDPDKPYVSLNMREGGSSTIVSEDLIAPKEHPANDIMVANYLLQVDKTSMPSLIQADDYISWIKQQFYQASGMNIDRIVSQGVPTEAERQAMANYREFAKTLINEANKQIEEKRMEIDMSVEKKETDMAILAFDCYGGDNEELMSKTNYAMIQSKWLKEDDPIRQLAEAIETCNKQTGFHAVLYHNNLTNEYAIGFEGSAMNISADAWNDWAFNNATQAAGVIGPQFILANTIANAINQLPPETKINITGHSLGGALATYVGLSTGKPTYTFNSEGLSDKILKDNNLFEKKNNGDFNITAYHASNDALTTSQKVAQNVTGRVFDPSDKSNTYVAKAIGTEVDLGVLNDNVIYKAGRSVIALSGITNSIQSLDGHRMTHVVNHILNQNSNTQEKWDNYLHAVAKLNAERAKISMRTIESINISFE
ncbi:hypothetical protein L6475_00260 [Prevotella sp. E9-3]|uniref:lipase family protein n=1 Tax=Prevotella sp. E9-3 TaxID=2913621 RepID=UPI001EDA1BB7|nr:hypothetical protein [Prevotella sp. E9-3]UKK48435.1 hypothetical protein L6475_00260 [Prevotella sp. E9-3]